MDSSFESCAVERQKAMEGVQNTNQAHYNAPLSEFLKVERRIFLAQIHTVF